MPRTPTKDDEGFSFIRNKLVHESKPPSLRTIAKYLGYKSPRSVQMMLDRLSRDGRISYINGKINLVHQADVDSGEQTVAIPLVGTAACGPLSLAEQLVEDHVEVSTKLARPGFEYFILRAKGDSMNRSEIYDGDLVLVRQQPTARDGQIVVALVNDEATIKHFHRDKGLVILKPHSTDPSFKPIILSADLIIQGVVVETLPNPF
jgi:repressor LexA